MVLIADSLFPLTLRWKKNHIILDLETFPFILVNLRQSIQRICISRSFFTKDYETRSNEKSGFCLHQNMKKTFIQEIKDQSVHVLEQWMSRNNMSFTTPSPATQSKLRHKWETWVLVSMNYRSKCTKIFISIFPFRRWKVPSSNFSWLIRLLLFWDKTINHYDCTLNACPPIIVIIIVIDPTGKGMKALNHPTNFSCLFDLDFKQCNSSDYDDSFDTLLGLKLIYFKVYLFISHETKCVHRFHVKEPCYYDDRRWSMCFMS